MIWLYRGVWMGGKFNNTRFWKKLLSFSILCFQLLNILGTKQVKPVGWVCLKCIHEYDFLIEFILGKWPNIQGVRNLIFFRTKCLFFFVKNTFLGMILNWGEFLLTSPIYRGSRLYNAGSGHLPMNIFGQIFPLCAETQTFRADTFIFLSQPLTSRSILCNKKEYKHNVDTNVDVDVICI